MEPGYPEALLRLMEHLKDLPGIGKRSAERMALSLYKWDGPRLGDFAEILRTLHEAVGVCPLCGNLADGPDADGKPVLCRICASPSRDRTSLCVIEEATQIRTIEASGVFRGVYHVLGGRIAPMEGKSVESLSLPALEKRLDEQEVREVILALSPDVEGQATAIYLANRLRPRRLRISRLARGLPAGSDLSYADPATIAIALSARVALDNE